MLLGHSKEMHLPVQLSPNYPEPPPPAAAAAAAAATATTAATDGDPATPAFPEQPKQLSADLVKAAKQLINFQVDVDLEVICMMDNVLSTNVLVKFDALVAALPLSEGGEEAQLKRIAELQAENDVIGQELQKQLEAAEKELKQVQELFGQAADNCLNIKKPE